MAYKFEIIDSRAWLVSLKNNNYIETELKKFFKMIFLIQILNYFLQR